MQVVILDGISDYSVVEASFMERFSSYDLHLTGNDAYIGSADEMNLIVQIQGDIGESYCYILESWPNDATEYARATLSAISNSFSFIPGS